MSVATLPKPGFMARMLQGLRAALPTVQRRNYAAAQVNRLTEGWTTSNISANASVHRSLDAVRARSQQLSNDDEYIKKWLGLVVTNTVGPNGFRFQARVYDKPGVPDDQANRAIETGWAAFCKPGVCDVTGLQSMTGLCQSNMRSAARDGEFLAQFVRGADAGNAFGLAIQLLDIARLDTQLNRPAQGATKAIRMGKELNAFGRCTHYWLKTAHPGDLYQTAGQQGATHVRVPASDIIHGFIADRPEQVRGMPWAHAAMTTLNNLGGYREAAIIASRVGASKMGFFTTPDGMAEPLASGKDAVGNLITDADPGTFSTLPEGTSFQPFDPDYPSAMFGPFMKSALHGVAAGLPGASYHSVTGDLESVSFSSIRSGTLEERDMWVLVQEWFAEVFLERVFAEFLKHALLFGQLRLDNGSTLPLAKLDKFTPHVWQGRRWDWVNPLQDIQADIEAINNNLKSPQSVASKLGTDYEDLLIEIQQAQAMRERLGIKEPLTAGQYAAAAGAAASQKPIQPTE